jgi:hypothetical protein
MESELTKVFNLVKIILVIQCEAQDQLILLGAIIVDTTEVIQGISVGVKGVTN